eukprot:TRINITY_DN12142_c0_g2_i1.p1 TRINITY_DN12142_c0_g2~~TRINITY_DN12142_c0_g2_i1.p1  ORF type:complete len:1139 (+),score=287.08 TRINITY_DN12142_c0_g2_i1:128-3418(+)
MPPPDSYSAGSSPRRSDSPPPSEQEQFSPPPSPAGRCSRGWWARHFRRNRAHAVAVLLLLVLDAGAVFTELAVAAGAHCTAFGLSCPSDAAHSCVALASVTGRPAAPAQQVAGVCPSSVTYKGDGGWDGDPSPWAACAPDTCVALVGTSISDRLKDVQHAARWASVSLYAAFCLVALAPLVAGGLPAALEGRGAVGVDLLLIVAVLVWELAFESALPRVWLLLLRGVRIIYSITVHSRRLAPSAEVVALPDAPAPEGLRGELAVLRRAFAHQDASDSGCVGSEQLEALCGDLGDPAALDCAAALGRTGQPVPWEGLERAYLASAGVLPPEPSRLQRCARGALGAAPYAIAMMTLVLADVTFAVAELVFTAAEDCAATGILCLGNSSAYGCADLRATVGIAPLGVGTCRSATVGAAPEGAVCPPSGCVMETQWALSDKMWLTRQLLRWGSVGLLAPFVLEALALLAGLGPRAYLRMPAHLADLALAAAGIALGAFYCPVGYRGWEAVVMRACRCARLFHLAAIVAHRPGSEPGIAVPSPRSAHRRAAARRVFAEFDPESTGRIEGRDLLAVCGLVEPPPVSPDPATAAAQVATLPQRVAELQAAAEGGVDPECPLLAPHPQLRAVRCGAAGCAGDSVGLWLCPAECAAECAAVGVVVTVRSDHAAAHEQHSGTSIASVETRSAASGSSASDRLYPPIGPHSSDTPELVHWLRAAAGAVGRAARGLRGVGAVGSDSPDSSPASSSPCDASSVSSEYEADVERTACRGGVLIRAEGADWALTAAAAAAAYLVGHCGVPAPEAVLAAGAAAPEVQKELVLRYAAALCALDPGDKGRAWVARLGQRLGAADGRVPFEAFYRWICLRDAAGAGLRKGASGDAGGHPHFQVVECDGGEESPECGIANLLSDTGVYCSAPGAGGALSVLLRADRPVPLSWIAISGARACTASVRSGAVWALDFLADSEAFFSEQMLVWSQEEAEQSNPPPDGYFETPHAGGTAVVHLPAGTEASWIAVRVFDTWGKGDSVDIGRITLSGDADGAQAVAQGRTYCPPPEEGCAAGRLDRARRLLGAPAEGAAGAEGSPGDDLLELMGWRVAASSP